MDSQQLAQVIIQEVKDFSKTKDEVTEDSVIGDYTKRRKTKRSEGKEIIKNTIIATLAMNGHLQEAKSKVLPSDWTSFTIRQVAQFFLPLLLLMLSIFPAQSQLQVTLGAGKTDLKESAIIVGISYLRTFDSIWSSRNNFVSRKNSFTSFYPEVDIRTGTADAFSSINVRMAGMTMLYKTKKVATVSRAGVSEDIIAPDLSRTFHTFPFSMGIESNNRFDNINGIAELGWAPWFQQIEALDNVEFYTGVQAGYKFSKRTDSLVGGEVSEVLEQPNKLIFRFHSEFGGSIDTLFKGSPFKMGIEGHAEVWYDIVNGALYKAGRGTIKLYVSPTVTLLGGLLLGSGMPLGNDAKQLMVGAKVKL